MLNWHKRMTRNPNCCAAAVVISAEWWIRYIGLQTLTSIDSGTIVAPAGIFEYLSYASSCCTEKG
jgi:hypothetical protein